MDIMDFVFQGFNRLWMVSVTFILNGSPQKIVQRGQITTPRRPINIRISDDYSIFENGAHKIDCYVGCVASDPALLKLNVVHVILFNFWKAKFVEHGTVTLAIDLKDGSLLIFEENGPMMPPYQNPHQTVTRRGFIGFSMMTFGFSDPQMLYFILKWKGSIFLIKPYF